MLHTVVCKACTFMIKGAQMIIFIICHVYADSAAASEMQDLRNIMPSISQVLLNLYADPGNTKLSMYCHHFIIHRCSMIV